MKIAEVTAEAARRYEPSKDLFAIMDRVKPDGAAFTEEHAKAIVDDPECNQQIRCELYSYMLNEEGYKPVQLTWLGCKIGTQPAYRIANAPERRRRLAKLSLA